MARSVRRKAKCHLKDASHIARPYASRASTTQTGRVWLSAFKKDAEPIWRKMRKRMMPVTARQASRGQVNHLLPASRFIASTSRFAIHRARDKQREKLE